MQLFIHSIFFLFVLYLPSHSLSQSGEFHEKEYECTDGVNRYFVLYVPVHSHKNNILPIVFPFDRTPYSQGLEGEIYSYLKLLPIINLADQEGTVLVFIFNNENPILN